MMLSELLIEFYYKLQLPQLPAGVEAMFPWQEPAVAQVMEQFYTKYFNDSAERTLILGINPGRLGGGVTAIPFTDPINMQRYCDIPNSFQKRHELSSEYIYTVIQAFGGPEAFYQHYLFSSTSPIGYTKNGVNLNYYDDKALQSFLEPHIVAWFQEQLTWNINKKRAIVLGQGKNFDYLKKLNEKHGFFEVLETVPHPRWVMQYRRRFMQDYVAEYLQKLAVQ